jgi:hypothetical protein
MEVRMPCIQPHGIQFESFIDNCILAAIIMAHLESDSNVHMGVW